MNVRDYIGRDFQLPHGCIEIIQRIFEGERGYPTGQPVEGFLRFLLRNRTEIETPEIGAVALFNGQPPHIGYMISTTEFIHAPNIACTSIVSPLDRPEYKTIFESFYRIDF